MNNIIPDNKKMANQSDVHLEIYDKFGSIDSVLTFNPFNYRITK